MNQTAKATQNPNSKHRSNSRKIKPNMNKIEGVQKTKKDIGK